MIADRIVSWLMASVSPVVLERSRRLLALSALVSLGPVLPVAAQLANPESLHLPRLSWWAASGSAMAVIGAIWLAASVALLFSDSVTASFGLAAAVSLAILSDRQVSGNYLVIIVIAATAHGCRTALSRSPSLHRVSGSPLRTIYSLGPIVMAWTAIAKLNPVFLSGAVLDAALSNGLVTIPVTVSSGVFRSLAILVVIGEFAMAGAFLMPGLRRWACVAALAFHSATIVLMASPLRFIAFALSMATSYALIWATWQPSFEVDRVLSPDMTGLARSGFESPPYGPG